MKTLYLFTNHYPYSYQENFLEDEILSLSSRFHRIVILSFDKDKEFMRSVPNNCEVENIRIGDNRFKYIICGLFHPRTFIVLLEEFFRSRVFLSKKRFSAWVSSARYLNNCLYNKKLEDVLKEMKKDDVAYFFWGIGQCLLSILLKGKVHLISRFHGEWDLWEESYGGFHSLRTDVAKSLDKAVFISKKGEEYFNKRYPNCSTAVYPLGSKEYGMQKPNPNDGIIRIVSCSTVYPLKRVPLIFEALNSMTELQIEWTHLGGGSHFAELEKKIKEEKRDHLSVKLEGMMNHDSVMDYYRNHHFDLFVNLSTSEGVPVSIMEAMSFNIPILATDVGSVSEEVPAQVGLLLTKNPTVEEVSNSIKKMLNTSFSPRIFWEAHYNAEKNYNAFAEMISQL